MSSFRGVKSENEHQNKEIIPNRQINAPLKGLLKCSNVATDFLKGAFKQQIGIRSVHI
jgi:hypothetical protein